MPPFIEWIIGVFLVSFTFAFALILAGKAANATARWIGQLIRR